MTDLQLFPDEGVTRPPGIPADAQPNSTTTYPCPDCQTTQLYWLTPTLAQCDNQYCGYLWTRSAQLHPTEPLPI